MKRQGKRHFDAGNSTYPYAAALGRAWAAIIALVLLGSGVSYGLTHYTITPILPVAPYTDIGCEGMAPNSGYVVGFELYEQPQNWPAEEGYRWQQPGPLLKLPTLADSATTYPWSQTHAVNDCGKAVGFLEGV